MVLCSLPTVVGALLQHAEPLPGWALQLARIELATDLSVAVNWGRSGLLLYNLIGGLLLVAAMLAAPAGSNRRAVLALFAAVAVLCAVAFVFIDVSLRGPISTLVARLQLPRAAWVVDVLGLVYVARSAPPRLGRAQCASRSSLLSWSARCWSRRATSCRWSRSGSSSRRCSSPRWRRTAGFRRAGAAPSIWRSPSWPLAPWSGSPRSGWRRAASGSSTSTTASRRRR